MEITNHHRGQADADELDTCRARGKVVGELRKQRSDAGVKHKQQDGIHSENERPKKHKKLVLVRKVMGSRARANKSQVPTSHGLISNSDDCVHSGGEEDSD